MSDSLLDPHQQPGRLPQLGEPGGWGKIFIARRYEPFIPSDAAEAFTGLVQFGLRDGDRRDYEWSKTMHKAANSLARKFLESDCDSICFIDSDALFGTNALEELRSDPEGWEYDVLQAFTVMRGWPPMPMYFAEWPDQPEGDRRLRGTHFTTIIPLDPDYIYPAPAVSLHFTLIRRSLLERMIEPQGPRQTYWFEYKNDEGEDINFSLKARAAGAKLGMSTRLKVGHGGYQVNGWDTMLLYFDRAFAYAAGEPPPTPERFQATSEARMQLSQLVAEYTGEPVEKIFERATVGGLRASDKWNRTKPATADQVHEFYRDLTEYFPELIRWNVSPSFQRILAGLKGVTCERVLEVGGGLGTLAEFLAVHGNRVDYYDLPGVLLDFARWRFARLNGRVPNGGTIEIVEQWAIGEYDRVTAIDVIEHFHPDEFDPLCAGMVAALKPGGVLYVHNNFDKQDDQFPFHYEHQAEWEAFVARHGLEQVSDFEWRKPK